MTSTLAQSVGVDISKDVLDVATFPGGKFARYPNDAKGIRELIRELRKLDAARIAFEATGAYHRLFERTLAQAGAPLVKVNPRRARRFAQATGKLAKTDRCDAAMLARMAAALQLEPRPVVSQTLDELKELQSARDALVKTRVAELNRQKTARAALIKRQIAERLRQIDAQIKAIDAEQTRLRDADGEISERFEILTSIPGVGSVTANALIVEMPELGHLDAPQAACLAGLAPFANESGTHRGKPRIQAGRARARKALYMPAINAIRPKGPFSQKYQAMIKAGKPAKVAIVAIMRKMLNLANALLRDRRTWTPNPA